VGFQNVTWIFGQEEVNFGSRNWCSPARHVSKYHPRVFIQLCLEGGATHIWEDRISETPARFWRRSLLFWPLFGRQNV